MANPLKLLCVHGIGHGDTDNDLRPSWEKAIRGGLGKWDAELAAGATLDFLFYDDIFKDAPNSPVDWAAALAKLLASEVVHGIGDMFHRERVFGGLSDRVRWTAGMVAQWVSNEPLRKSLRALLTQKLQAGNYDGLLAHSLGSLICYDTLIRDKTLFAGKTFVTFGSQIGNPAVRDVFGGYLMSVAQAGRWYHLYNPNDHVFTAQLRFAEANRQDVTTEFDIPNDPINHDGAWYLGHADTTAAVWRDLAKKQVPSAVSRGLSRSFANVKNKPNPRALLIGINDYPNPDDHLNGCVNDVYLMSSLLQETGFDASDIRVVLNERATAAGIMSRMEWLLQDADDGQDRVLFYSGHGAQIPAYGDRGEVDHQDECLVPYDFDWTPQRAITDNQFHELYSQLPYDTRFLTIFDCCHSGGMSRDGARKVRGLTPPDDIRHRALRWNAKLQMWEERDLPSLNPSLQESGEGRAYLGASGSTRRLGRASQLRGLPNTEYNALRKTFKHHGPYLPVIMEACQEGQYSYEYRHGAQSYGAFTYSLATVVREQQKLKSAPSFAKLVEEVSKRLKRLRYDQTPCLVGPKVTLNKGWR